MKILIYGNGSFGMLLLEIMTIKGYDIDLYDPINKLGNSFKLNEYKVVIMAIPAQYIEESIFGLSSQALLIDVASVKEYPKSIYIKYKRKAILTHPMFGPNSYKEKGLKNQKIMVDYSLVNHKISQEFKKYIKNLGLLEFEMNSESHDKITAKTLVLHHIIGRIIPELFEEELDTLNYNKIKSIYYSVKNDSDDLFNSLLKYNKYSKDIIKTLNSNLEKLNK